MEPVLTTKPGVGLFPKQRLDSFTQRQAQLELGIALRQPQVLLNELPDDPK